jgi:cobyrinic acid a,c-diamide synthase
MVGALEGEAVMKDKLVALGYVEVETQEPTILGPAGLRFRGHQFRYSDLTPAAGPNAPYSVRRRRGGDVVRDGHRVHNVLASYVHAHWASNPLAARGFVRSCAKFAAHKGLAGGGAAFSLGTEDDGRSAATPPDVRP